ncbi:TPA: Arc family DNA-binding protein [Yersinia enterocolitica]|uniref:Arc family DNA-binding protein n=1 Tax=Yersinia TaxID=629 RepID=UPI0006831E75|nr:MULTISPECIES: Arc family DNA-binding protein [Yersinia]EKN4904661.1 Arc family DNA-binding protein [Yersinia enterocolitica]EKN5164226.1 Arc family DNA-binding protein [Yersinia enterocolitica]EKN6054107.1 Arc family DNA-binding protein [Yersinia enterocolitica]EKN6076254.1 Arc family DNA-binding protein [Yersinia enterocolitica]ELW8194976.1 Arc family DNA-binding protein [Yersinia enterocolitica]
MTEKDDPNFIERFTVRMPDGMRDAIADRAKKNGRSMNSEIVQILQDALIKESIFGDIANTEIEQIEYDPDKEITLTSSELKDFLKNAAKGIIDDASEQIAKNATEATLRGLLEIYDLVPKDEKIPPDLEK